MLGIVGQFIKLTFHPLDFHEILLSLFLFGLLLLLQCLNLFESVAGLVSVGRMIRQPFFTANEAKLLFAGADDGIAP